MSLLPSNSFYSSFARKGKGTGNVPRNGATGIISPGSSTGLYPAAPKPPAPLPTPSAPGSPSSPSGPPAGFTVTQGGLPPDPAYQATYGGLVQTRDDTISGLKQQRGAGLQEYGYTEDPTTHAVAFDPNNPYSQAALLRKHYQQAKTGNTNSYAAQGQLYAGSLQNAQNASTDDFNRGDNALTRGIINFLANNTTAQQTAGNQFNTNAGIALGQSVQGAPTNPLYNPTAAAGGGVYSTDANGNVALTAANGPLGLVPQSPNSTVKLANGWSVLLDAQGNAIRFIPPGG